MEGASIPLSASMYCCRRDLAQFSLKENVNRLSSMSTTLAKVQTADEFINPELRAVVGYAKKSELTAWYRVGLLGEEVAFLAIERLDKHFFLHQIVVHHAQRGFGVGSAVLRAVEDLAHSEGVETVRIWPRPLDNSFDQKGLERWYCERGYIPVADGTGDLEKRIASSSLDHYLDFIGELRRGVMGIAAEWTAYHAASFANSTKALEKLVGAKSFEDTIKSQTQYVENAYEGSVAQMRKCGETYARLMRTALRLEGE